MFASKDLFLTPPSGGYTIARSVRLRSSASSYFNRTTSSTTNQKTFTWSSWIKIGDIASGSLLTPFCFGFNPTGATDVGTFFRIYQNQITFSQTTNGTADYTLTTTQVFRDPSAWYHVVVAFDTTQATSSNRIKLYINGVQVTAFSTATYPTLNFNTSVNLATGTPKIGAIDVDGAVGGQYFDGYLTEINFIDGQALTPSSFGTTNAITGVWQPIKYTGTYGTNGFYLNFSDNSNNTSTTIGKDYSGNGNNWTPNNISVTAGVTYDSMTDVPTLTSATAANYAVLNPLRNANSATVSNGNLSVTNGTAGTWRFVPATMSQSSGKQYIEVNNTVTTATYCAFFLCTQAQYESANGGYPGSYVAGYSTQSGDTTGVIYQFAIDYDAGKIWIGRNNTWLSGGNPATGTTPQTTFTANTILFLYIGCFDSSIGYTNFGQQPWSYTPPTGFVALNTNNLPAGTITTSGSFTGNVSTDGPFVYLNGVPTAMTINGNAVTFGTNADKLANGFKVRSSSSSYNASGSNTYSITTTGAKFKNANAQTNP